MARSDAFFFKHDLNARGDEKIVMMLRKHGPIGYGIYWMLIEKLYEAGGRIRPDFETLAFDLRCDQALIRSVVEDFELFYFTSPMLDKAMVASRSVDRRLRERRDLCRKKALAGAAGGRIRAENKKLRKAAEDHTKAASPLPSRNQADAKHVPSRPQAKSSEERRREEKRGDTTAAAAPQAGKPLTPIQRVVLAYKIAKGNREDDRDWDREQFPRCSKAAKAILECFGGDLDKAVVYLLGKAAEWDEKGLDWTLETVKKHAWDNRGKLETNGPEHSALDADRVLEHRGPVRTSPAGGPARGALEAIAGRVEEAHRLGGPGIPAGDADQVWSEPFLDERDV